MLSNDIRNRLIEAAKQARKKAYAPYSGDFKVGAAVLTEDGSIFEGCNIENSSFGATVCAERVAIFKAVCEGFRTIRALAVVTPSDRPDPPCGLCLQVLAEFSDDAEVIMVNTSENTKISSIKKLLPVSFRFRPRNR